MRNRRTLVPLFPKINIFSYSLIVFDISMEMRGDKIAVVHVLYMAVFVINENFTKQSSYMLLPKSVNTFPCSISENER
jgi:hypothetical protein